MKRSLWKDCRGGIITTELVLVASFVTAMLLSGLGLLKNKISNEFESLGNIVESQRVTVPAGSCLNEKSKLQGTEFEGMFDVDPELNAVSI